MCIRDTHKDIIVIDYPYSYLDSRTYVDLYLYADGRNGAGTEIAHAANRI